MFSISIIGISYAFDSSVSEITTDEGFGTDVTWIDVPSSSSQTFTGANGVSISTKTLVDGGTTFVQGAAYVAGTNKFLQISFPRNIVFDIGFLLGESTTGANGTVLITGKDGRGNSTTETVLVSTGTAAAPGIGVKAWSWVDSFDFSGFTISSATGQPQDGGAVSISTCSLHIGVGSKLGLPYDVRLSTDIIQLTVDYVAYSSATWKSINATHDTVDTSQLSTGLGPNGSRDYRARGKALKNHTETAQ